MTCPFLSDWYFNSEKASAKTVTTGCWLCRGSVCRALPVKQQLED